MEGWARQGLDRYLKTSSRYEALFPPSLFNVVQLAREYPESREFLLELGLSF